MNDINTASAPAVEVKYLNANRSQNILDHFPFPTIRPTQKQALQAIEKWLLSDKKFFILEGPTGFGKSGVAIAAGSFAKTVPTYGEFEPGAYILSPQKTLTEQYMDDFGKNGLVELKGQSNYYCSQFDMDCEAAGLVFEDMHDMSTCTGYKPAKEIFMNASLGVTNFAYYLAETTTAHQLPDRTLLVLDEGHNCEDMILGFTDTTITQKKCDEYNVGTLPKFPEGAVEPVRQWILTVFVPAAQVKRNELRSEFQKAREAGENDKKAKLAKRISGLDLFLKRIQLFTDAEVQSEWFAYTDWDEKYKRGTGDLIIKPLTARLFADQIMFSKAQKVLIMSATILDFATFMRNLGITRENAEILAVDSEFPLENRPIFFKEVGDMGWKNIEKTLPYMAKEVDAIMTQPRYANKKGIVHTQSFKTNKYITEHVSVGVNGKRILTHATGVKGSREGAVEQHYADLTSPTVLFSPSMTEGLDLKGDLSRFQIIVKVPYPALDPYMRARMNRDEDWYTWLTALKLVQATGRSVRSNTDKAHTWILDSGFRTFLRRAKGTLPRWWTDSIIDMKKL